MDNILGNILVKGKTKKFQPQQVHYRFKSLEKA
jgi:hypothetical protein